jgi:hypothetical protein
MDDAGAIAWIRGDVAEMAAFLREAEAGQPVPGCPGWCVSDLSRHIAIGFAAWYPYNMSTPADSWSVEGLMARFAAVGDDHSQNVDAFESGAAEFLGYCSEMDLTQPSWSFGAVEPAGWWIRRAGTELTVHLTDAAGVLGRAASTSPEGHCEAIDEVTSQVMPRLADVKQVMTQLSGEARGDAPPVPERPAALTAEDTGRHWTLFRAGDGRSGQQPGVLDDAGAVGSGSSADVLAWLHGRPMTAELTIDGDAQLLHDWNLLQRAPL